MKRHKKTRTYKQSKKILFSGIAFFIFSIGLLYVWISGWEIDNNRELISVISIMIFFFLCGTFTTFSYLSYSVTVSKEKLIIVSDWHKKTELYWTSVDHIEEHRSQRAIIIIANNKRFKISASVVNYKQLFSHLIENMNSKNISSDLIQHSMTRATTDSQN